MWMKLSGRKTVMFQPRLTAEHTNYSGSGARQWVLSNVPGKHLQRATLGLRMVSTTTVGEAWKDAAGFLCRIGARPVRRRSGPTGDVL